MKNLITKSFAIFGLLALLSIFSFGQETQTAPQTNAATVKIGIALPKANFSEGVDNAQMAAGIRDMIGGYFKGTNIEIVALEARLPQAIVAEAKEKGCAFVLRTAVTQKKSSGGFGMFKAIAPALGNVVPLAGRAGSVAGQVAGTVAQTAIMTAANMSSTTKSKDQFTFEYSLVSTADNTVKATETIKVKAKSDGEDVLSPMIEKMAEKVVTFVKLN
jgi:hypothetical protein